MDGIISVSHKCCLSLLVVVQKLLRQQVKILFEIWKRQMMMTALVPISLIAFIKPRSQSTTRILGYHGSILTISLIHS
uniref:Uncharacterized protein n=1 Tax=Hyaloperonospora arabidopsidis (strain Emoy2) TaxID=559515 RepID=M4BYA7_HYAAE